MEYITIAIRFSDLTIGCFKTHKQFALVEMSNISFLLDEEKFKKFLLKHKEIKINFNRESVDAKDHNSNDSEETFFAPLTYGIIYIDFSKKEIYSNNGYSNFLEYDINETYQLFAKYGKDPKFIAQERYDYKATVNSFKNGSFAPHTYPLFKKCHYPTTIFFNLLELYLNKGEAVIKDENSDEILRRYAGDMLEPLLFVGSFIRDRESSKDDSDTSFSNLSGSMLSLGLKPKDWNIVQGGSTKQEFSKLYKKLSEEIDFTPQEIACWNAK